MRKPRSHKRRRVLIIKTHIIIIQKHLSHDSDVLMGAKASRITSLTFFTQAFIQAQINENIKSLRNWPFVRGIHRWPVNFQHKWSVTRKTLPFDDVIMKKGNICKNLNGNIMWHWWNVPDWHKALPFSECLERFPRSHSKPTIDE